MSFCSFWSKCSYRTDGTKMVSCIAQEKLATDEVVEKRSKQLLKLLDALRSAKGERSTKIVDGEWKVKQDTPQFRVMYREGPEGAPYHSLCLDGVIDGPLSHALVVAWEVPMYKEWWPQFVAPTFKITESRWLERNTVGGDHSVLRFKVPWPFAMREVILSAYELEYFDEDLVAVLYKTAPDVPEEKVDGISSTQIPGLHSNAVRMDLEGGFVLQKIGHNRSFFRVVVDLDMKLDLVPPWLINFIARQLLGLGYKLYQKAVAGVKGSPLEKLLDTEPMYKRIQALDDMSLNMHDPALMAMLPPEKGLAGLYKVPHKQEEIDRVEYAIKALSDQRLPKPLNRTPEDVLVQERQDTCSDSNIFTADVPISNASFADIHDKDLNILTPVIETNGIEMSTMSLVPEQQIRLASEEDGPSDPEVVWALEFLEKLIMHFSSQRASSQNFESRETLSVENDNTGNSEPICSTAKLDFFNEAEEFLDTQEEFLPEELTKEHITCETKVSYSIAAHTKAMEGPTGSSVQQTSQSSDYSDLNRVGSEKISAALDGNDIIQQRSRAHHRGFRFFRFGKWRKDAGKSFKKQDITTV
uniref:START domain-containing protein n=2 Tax=Physcomitrium patens TaxID=3218 RepID=A0A7I4F5P8_PHYPA